MEIGRSRPLPAYHWGCLFSLRILIEVRDFENNKPRSQVHFLFAEHDSIVLPKKKRRQENAGWKMGILATYKNQIRKKRKKNPGHRKAILYLRKISIIYIGIVFRLRVGAPARECQSVRITQSRAISRWSTSHPLFFIFFKKNKFFAVL